MVLDLTQMLVGAGLVFVVAGALVASLWLDSGDGD